MERPPRIASHVPTIKCSTCGRDIDLALISEHVCTLQAGKHDQRVSADLF